jgi:hypothetical protein
VTFNRNQIIGVTFILIAISVLGYARFRRHELDNNYRIAIGQVTEITGPGAKSGADYGLNYIYEVNNKQYSGEISLSLCGTVKMKDVKQFTLNKNFPVAYDTKYPSASMIILSLESAERYKYKMPDSLYPCLRHIDCDYYLNVKPEDYSK